MKKQYNAIKCIQNGRSFFIAKIDSNTLKQICFITRRSEDPEAGFQRLLNVNRAKSIAKYLDTENMSIPSPIILSSQENANFSFKESDLKIDFELVPSSFLVIDGQHRLFGLKISEKNYEFPVVIYTGLSRKEEVNLFIDINTTQKGVPTALLLDIKELAGRQTTTEELQREIFDRLSKDSVLAGNLLPASSANNKISRKIFNESTLNLLEQEPLKNKDVDLIFKSIRNYFEAFSYTFSESGYAKITVTNSSYFKSICALFPEVAAKSLLENGNLKTESFVKVLEPIKNLDFDKYTGSGNAIISKITKEMRSAITTVTQLTDDLV